MLVRIPVQHHIGCIVCNRVPRARRGRRDGRDVGAGKNTQASGVVASRQPVQVAPLAKVLVERHRLGLQRGRLRHDP